MISSGKWTDLKTKANDPSCKSVNYIRKKDTSPSQGNPDTHEFFDDSLDEIGEIEPLVRLTVPDILAEYCDCFCISVGVEGVASFDQDSFELLV